MTGVLFSRSRIPLQLWFYAMLHFANSAESLVGSFLARQLEVSSPTAFRLGQRIRWHMAALDEKIQVGAADETVVIRLTKILRIINPRTNTQNSAAVLLLCDRHRVNSTVMIRPRQKQLRSVIAAKVNSSSRLITDCYWTFRALSNYSSGKPLAEHIPDYYLDRNPSENLNHGFLQYFNLSFSNQFRGVNLENAWLYLKEYEFRYNRRNRSAEIFTDMISSFPPFDQRSLDRISAAHFITPVPR